MSVTEYLEKYSVTSLPSRDFYGIKLHRNEVILYQWKRSHVPYKKPTIKVTKFSLLNEGRSLQGEIQRVFGNYLLHYVRNIPSRENSILTLPRHIIASITEYLSLKDIYNLKILSRTAKEVFDNEVVWETLYRKYKGSQVSEEEKKSAMATSWKQVLKDKRLLESLENYGCSEDKPKISQIVTRSTSIQLVTDHRTQNSSILYQQSVQDSRKLPTSESPLRSNTPSKISAGKPKYNLKSTTSMTKLHDAQKSFPANKTKTNLKKKEINRSPLTLNKNILQKPTSSTKPKSSVGLYAKSAEDLKTRKTPIPNSYKPKKSDQTLRSQKPVPVKEKTAPKTKTEEVKPKQPDEGIPISGDGDKNLSREIHMDNLNSLIDENLTNIDMAHFAQKYLRARAQLMKKVSDASKLSTLRTNHSSVNNYKFPQTLSPIPENLKQDEASNFPEEKVKDEITGEEKSKGKGKRNLKK